MSGQTAQVTCNAVNSGYASAAATHVATRACNNGVWQSPTLTACTACAADASKGFNVDIAHGATDTVTCAVFDSVVHAGDTPPLVTRSCANGVVSYNYALCTAVCAANSGWVATPVGTTISRDCVDAMGSNQYSTSNIATRTCGSGGSWATAVTSACVKQTCAASGVWPETDAGSTASIDCSVYNSDFATGSGTQATQICTAGATAAWSGTVNASSCTCAGTSDVASATVFAWPASAQSTVKVLCHRADPLYPITGLFASRVCGANGWETVDVTNCDTIKNDDSTAGALHNACVTSGSFGTLFLGQVKQVDCNTDANDFSNASNGPLDGPSGSFAIGYCDKGGDADTNTANPRDAYTDFSACAVRVCPASGLWPETAQGATASIACSVYNPGLFSSGLATRLCTGTPAAPAWETAANVDISLCVYHMCAADSFVTTAHFGAVAAASSAIQCGTYDTGIFTGTEKVSYGCPPENVSNSAHFSRSRYYDTGLCVAKTCAAEGAVTAATTAAGGQVTNADCYAHDPTMFGTTAVTSYTCNAFGAGTWKKVVSGCGCKGVVLDGVTYADTAHSASSALSCSTWTGYTAAGVGTPLAGTISRSCTSGVWQTPVESCTFANCANDSAGGITWTATAPGASHAATACNLYIATGDSATKFKATGTITRTCSSKGVWGAPSLAGCTYLDCAATGPWPLTTDNSYATAPCSAVDATKYISGKASRICQDSEWGTYIDTSLCILLPGLTSCPAAFGIPRTMSGAATVTGLCSTYSAEYASGSTSATCTNGSWVVTTTNCVKKQCALSGSWSATDVGTIHAAVDCATLDTTYNTGTATRRCYLDSAGSPNWYDADISACAYADCAADGIWSTTSAQTMAEISCSTFSSGFAVDATKIVSRACEQGTWETFYSLGQCTLNSGQTMCPSLYPFVGAVSTSAAVTRTVNCIELDPITYASGTATRVCAIGASTWSALDLSACAKKTCASAVDSVSGYTWPAGTAVGEYAEIACSTFDPQYRITGQVVRSLCSADTDPAAYGPAKDVDGVALLADGTGTNRCNAANNVIGTLGGPSRCYLKEVSHAKPGGCGTNEVVWDASEGTSATMTCDLWCNLYSSAQSVTRSCAANVFGLPNASLCVPASATNQCAGGSDEGVTWPDTPDDVIVRMACPTGATDIYASGFMQRKCGSGNATWGPTHTENCVLRGCAAGNDANNIAWNAATYDTTVSVDCATYNPNLYASGSVTRVCGTTASGSSIVWGALSTAGCVKKYCADDAIWGSSAATPSTAVAAGDTSAAISCNLIDSNLPDSFTATRSCTASSSGGSPSWAAVSLTSCGCPASGGFALTASGAADATMNCVDYDATLFQSGTVTRTCTSGNWGEPNVSACVLATGVSTCASDGNWVRGYGGRKSEIACNTLDSSIYKSGFAWRMCHGTTWSVPDLSDCVKYCPSSGGYSAALEGEMGIKACTSVDATHYLSGNSYKTCANGVFGPADDTNCILKKGHTKCAASADGLWATSFGGDIVGVACNTISKFYASAGSYKAWRSCDAHATEEFLGVWSDVDETDCVSLTCATNSGFPTTNAGSRASVDCSVHNSSYKTGAATQAHRTCVIDFSTNTASWSEPDVTACLWMDCPASGTYATAVFGAASTKTCATEDASKFATTGGDLTTSAEMASKTCGANKTFGAADVSACLTALQDLRSYCPAEDDFPFTLAETGATVATVTVNCNDYNPDVYASGTLTRECTKASGWGTMVLTACVKHKCPLDNTADATNNPSGYSYAAATTQAGDTVTVACATYDSSKYTGTTENTTRLCKATAGSAAWDPA